MNRNKIISVQHSLYSFDTKTGYMRSYCHLWPGPYAHSHYGAFWRISQAHGWIVKNYPWTWSYFWPMCLQSKYLSIHILHNSYGNSFLTKSDNTTKWSTDSYFCPLLFGASHLAKHIVQFVGVSISWTYLILREMATYSIFGQMSSAHVTMQAQKTKQT